MSLTKVLRADHKRSASSLEKENLIPFIGKQMARHIMQISNKSKSSNHHLQITLFSKVNVKAKNITKVMTKSFLSTSLKYIPLEKRF